MGTITLALVAILAATGSTNATALVKRSRSSGCGITHTGKGQTKHNSTMSGGLQQGQPARLSDAPLIPWQGKDMDYQAQLTRFNWPAVNPNMIAVFPNGQESNLGDGDRCWQGPNYCNTGISDKVFISDLIAWMKDHYCVDDSKIYASGKSVGGGFVDVLACSPGYGGNLVAFAIDAGAMYNQADGSGCTPARKPMPILELHGTEDHTANYNGDTSHGQPLPRIRPLLQKWAERNGCVTGTAPISDVRGSNGVYKTNWNCASGARTVVTGYNVTGQGHDWISTQPNDDNKGNVGLIDASTIVMSFFNSWTKP